MAFEYQSISTQTNKSVVLNFSAPVVFYLPGISYYSLTHGRKDHHVQELGLSLEVNQPSPQQLQVHVNGIMRDASGNGIDDADSRVTVVVLAWTGTNPGTLLLANAGGIPNNGQSGPIALPSASLSVFQSVLSGFNLAYTSEDHHVLYESSGVGIQQNGATGFIQGKAGMGDSSGNTASNPTVNGGLIAAASGVDLNAGFEVLAGQQTNAQVNVSFAKPLKAAAAMIINNTASYSKDHHVKTVGAGTTGLSINGSTVVLDNARAFLSDSSDNNQDDGKSSTSLLVIGFYA